jgi:hypothetical protein
MRHPASPVETPSPPLRVQRPPFLDVVAGVWKEFGANVGDSHVFDWCNERTTHPGGLPEPGRAKVTCNGEEIQFVLACLAGSTGGIVVAYCVDDRGQPVPGPDGGYAEVFVRVGSVQVSVTAPPVQVQRPARCIKCGSGNGPMVDAKTPEYLHKRRWICGLCCRNLDAEEAQD